MTLDELVKKGAPQPAQAACPAYGGAVRSYRFEYEYKSKRKFLGLPLVHIHIGRGLCRAKGILAIGNLATGLLSFGLISAGILSFGALSLGLVAFGALSVGLLLAIGGFSAGTFAIGGICAGVFALGGIAVGMFSTGGVAIASHVAIGGFASGHIAIGDAVQGVQTIHIDANSLTSVSAGQVRALIQQEFPGLWGCFPVLSAGAPDSQVAHFGSPPPSASRAVQMGAVFWLQLAARVLPSPVSHDCAAAYRKHSAQGAFEPKKAIKPIVNPYPNIAALVLPDGCGPCRQNRPAKENLRRFYSSGLRLKRLLTSHERLKNKDFQSPLRD